jgi:hypothetical protein
VVGVTDGEAGVAAVRHSGEALTAAVAVAAALIGLVFAVPGLHAFVTAAPWLTGPALWLATTSGAACLLQVVTGRRPPRARLAAAIVLGAAADALVVVAGHPWPGLAAGIAVFSLVLGAGTALPSTRIVEPQEVNR